MLSQIHFTTNKLLLCADEKRGKNVSAQRSIWHKLSHSVSVVVFIQLSSILPCGKQSNGKMGIS